MEYKVNYFKSIDSAYLNYTEELNPSEFLGCKNEEELREEIHSLFLDNIVCEGDINIRESVTTIDIPDDFLDEWYKLKNFNKHDR